MSLVLYGPPGTGKTTLAHVISLATKRQFVQLSALDSGVKEVRAVITAAKRELTYAGRRTVLFIDEVHRFSKTQQDSLLSAVEDRIVSLIAATTENPFFSVVSPLLSPQPGAGPAAAVATTTSAPCCTRALTSERGLDGAVTLTAEAEEHLVRVAGGDARKALTALESGAGAAVAAGTDRDRPGDAGDGGRPGRGPLRPAGRPALRRRQRADQEHPRQRRRRRAALPGPDGRGGGGPAVHRPPAGHLRQRGHRHGRPDGAADRGRRRRRGRLHRHARGPLPARAGRRAPGHGAEVQRGHGGAWASRSPTSRAGLAGPVPPGLRDAHYAGAKKLGHGKTYDYPHAHPDGVVPQQYPPDALVGKDYYRPTNRGAEARLVERLAKLRAIVRRGR